MRALLLGLVALALVSGGAVYMLISSRPPAEPKVVAKQKTSEDVFFVLIAAKSLPPGHKIERGDVEWMQWPKAGLQAVYVQTSRKDAEPKAVVGRMVRSSIAKGMPMLKRLTFDPGEGGFLAGALEPGMRAVTIAVKPETGGVGFITPGDRVDIILTHDIRKVAPRRRGEPVIAQRVVRHSAEAILHGIRVIAVDRKVDEANNEVKATKTVTVEVTPRQAETIAVALEMGRLSVTLRSLASTEGGEPDDAFTTDLDISQTLQATLGKSPVLEPSPEPVQPRRIRVFRAGQASSTGN